MSAGMHACRFACDLATTQTWIIGHGGAPFDPQRASSGRTYLGLGACKPGQKLSHPVPADLLIHYGHSCLVPVDVTTVPCLYVFVDIQIDTQHLIDSIR